MHRRLWLLVGAAAALLVVAGAATARSKVAGHRATASGATMAAAPFAEAWAKVPATSAGRKAANVVVVGAEQTFNGFNTDLNCCNQLWATFAGGEETMHGAFIQNQKGDWIKDLVSNASANAQGVSYTIRPDAYWYWGGKKLPVTYKDFVYTMQQIDNPNNDLQGRTGYSNLNPTKFTHKGDKQITVFWKTTNCSSDYPCGPFADWQYLFSTSLFPAQALAGQDFNKIWTNCVCGNDGQPVSDGPYYVSNYTAGQGVTLKANPFYYQKAKIGEVDFKFITDTNSEEEAMRGGEVDLITPTFGSYLQPLKSTPGLTFDQIPGYYFEHLDIREGNAKAGPSVSKGSSNVLLRAPWMREAVMMGIDRQSIINTVYGALAGNTKPMNNMLYYSTQSAYKPDFQKWNYNPAKALAVLKKHCTGGPSSPSASNTSIWQCAGLPAAFNWSWTASNSVRTTTEAIVAQELQSIGIKLNARPTPANVIFGPNGLPSGDFDIAEFAQITTGDAGDWYDQNRCYGNGNWDGFCSHTVDALTKAGNSELDPAKRVIDFQKADAVLASLVPMIPFYQRPSPVIHKADLLGVINNPALVGTYWNIQQWHWK
jgi:peptide/nickel transport system substrate-binding protein